MVVSVVVTTPLLGELVCHGLVQTILLQLLGQRSRGLVVLIAAVDRGDTEKSAAEKMVAGLCVSLVSAQVGHANQTVDPRRVPYRELAQGPTERQPVFPKAASAPSGRPDSCSGRRRRGDT